ncbi:MAG: AAA family ATPase [Dokdonella sp.]|nr:AAA family ATPase [Dokdonella sp.]
MAVEKLLILSGGIGVGKTEVAKELTRTFQFKKISSSGYLISLIPLHERKEGDELRRQLQELGDCLDERTGYRWVVDPVAIQIMDSAPEIKNWLVDAVRKQRQVELFRERFGPLIRHVHLTASEDVLRLRYAEKGNDYNIAIAHSNEANARNLQELADLVLDTSSAKVEDLAQQIILTWEVSHA